MIAALFVEKGGVYYGLPSVEPWDKEKDARLYQGPYPVVAHPPCERWGIYARGGPTAKRRFVVGDDAGCFESALWAVRKWGGVLEHPECSHAWAAFYLSYPPQGGGWIRADPYGGFTCRVEQGAYGHLARKATWLYVCHYQGRLPALRWGIGPKRARTVEELSKKQKKATPPEFRDLLLRIADRCRLEVT